MCTQVLLGLSATLTVLVLNIHHQGVFGHSVPKIVKRVVNLLARTLCFKGTARIVWQNPTDTLQNQVSLQNQVTNYFR